MLLREKGSKDEAKPYGWDEAQALLQTGDYEVVEEGAATEEAAEKPAAEDDRPKTEPKKKA